MDIKSQLVSQVWGQTHDQHCGNCRQLVTTYTKIFLHSLKISWLLQIYLKVRDNNVFIVHRRYFMKIKTICECLQLPEKNLNFWHRQKKTPAVYIVKVMPGLMGLI